MLLLQVLHEHQASVRFDLIPFIFPVAPQAWRTTAPFSGVFIWHGWPGTCFRSRRKQALRFWSGLLDATTLSFTSSRLSQGSGFSLKHGKNVTLDRCRTTGFQLRNVAHPTCQPPTCSIFTRSSTEVDSTAHKLIETWENQEEPSASFKKGCGWTD